MCLLLHLPDIRLIPAFPIEEIYRTARGVSIVLIDKCLEELPLNYILIIFPDGELNQTFRIPILPVIYIVRAHYHD